jgi:hypothetical protein
LGRGRPYVDVLGILPGGRGQSYAEQYALRYEAAIRYRDLDEFGLD